MKTKNIISFCLYGSQKKYTVGAVKNAELAMHFFPGWTVRFYVGSDVPDETLTTLLKRECELVLFVRGIPPMFQRFLVADDEQCNRFIVRDADSRLDARDRDAVNEWVASGKRFSVFRDHPAHGREINGGLFGGIAGSFRMQGLMSLWLPGRENVDDYGMDQQFLCEMVWPFVMQDVLQHDSFSSKAYPGSKPFPTKRVGKRFCGEVFDENENPRDYDRKQIPLED